MVGPRHRGVVVVRGSPEDTYREAAQLLAGCPEVLWVSAQDDHPENQRPADVRRLAGCSVLAVVLDLHAGLDPDLLGIVHGFVRGGGRLVLRMPPQPPPCSPGYHNRLWNRLESVLEQTPARVTSPPAAGIQTHGTQEQASLVSNLTNAIGCGNIQIVLTADRGRGKSAALGMLVDRLPPTTPVWVTGPHPTAVAEVLRFSTRPLVWTDPVALLSGPPIAGLLLVDEAAQLPVPVLQSLVESFPDASMLFSTTVHGYEGTGRGFLLKFVEDLASGPRPFARFHLTSPIRWASDDPLERFVFDLLALDAEPPPVDAQTPLRFARWSQDDLQRDPTHLSAVFGLLVAAHYRTTPEDLHRLLDAPDTHIHIGTAGATPAAVGWLVEEGGLDDATIDAMASGARFRGQVLTETLVCHSGHRAAGALRWMRSVRTVVHPDLRKKGVAAQLVAAEHAAHPEVDLFGTVFGATPALVRFRQRLGYVVVRLGVSRGARTGVPSVVMVRPQSAAGHALVDLLRAECARDLPGQLQWMSREVGPRLSDHLRAALTHELPAAAPWTARDIASRVEHLLRGAMPLDSAGDAPRLWLEAVYGSARPGLTPLEAACLSARVDDGHAWTTVAAHARVNVAVAQRATRRALRQLVADAGGPHAIWMLPSPP